MIYKKQNIAHKSEEDREFSEKMRFRIQILNSKMDKNGKKISYYTIIYKINNN